ncbi:MAG: ATP phosphoribosyltransferase regulatory subunit [Clostridium sp.]
MSIVKGFVPEGVEDINSLEFGIKENLTNNINNLFKSFGYRQILTPTFEYYDLFNEIEGTIEKEEMFKFIDRHGRILVLRPDATIPIARMALSSYRENKEALKFSYSTSVYRMNGYEDGKKAEFVQAGVEFLGEEGPDADAEVIVMAIKSILKCGFNDFKIDIGEASYFKALLETMKISKVELQEIKKYIESKNFAGLQFYLENISIDESIKKVILSLPMLYGSMDKVYERASELCLNENMKKALDNLYKIYEVIKEYGFEKYILVDLGLVSHINYYTGVVFKGYVTGYGKEVLGGGRYDNLTKTYGEYMPSTGFGINIDALYEAMKQNGLFKSIGEKIDFAVLYSVEKRKDAIKIASLLRDAGYSVDIRRLSNSDSIQNGYKETIVIADRIYVKEPNEDKSYESIKQILDSIESL